VVTAFLVQIIGSIAFGMISGLLQEMVPSAPPGWGNQELEAQPHPLRDALSNSFSRNRFALIFGLVLAMKSAPRLARYSGSPRYRKAAAAMLSVTHRLSGKWFKLLVANAFIAYFTTLALQWGARFSWTQMLWDFALDCFRPLLHTLAGLIPWPRAVQNGQSLLSWYGENQFKFNFWLLYSAAICDDLGLPNFKTLGRWAWRRLVRRPKPTVAVAAE